MADGVTVKVDVSRALAKFKRAPQLVTNELLAVLPPIMRDLADLMMSNLAARTKSQSSITMTPSVTGRGRGIEGKVTVASSVNPLLPRWLEAGTRPHEIIGNPILAFFWEKAGKMMFLPHVNHPGTKPIWYARDAMRQMRPEITEALREAAKAGARKA